MLEEVYVDAAFRQSLVGCGVVGEVDDLKVDAFIFGLAFEDFPSLLGTIGGAYLNGVAVVGI